MSLSLARSFRVFWVPREGRAPPADGLFCLQVSLWDDSSLSGAWRGSACGSRAVRRCLSVTLSCLLHDPGRACWEWFQSWEAADCHGGGSAVSSHLPTVMKVMGHRIAEPLLLALCPRSVCTEVTGRPALVEFPPLSSLATPRPSCQGAK